MKRKDILELYKGLNSVGALKGVNFTYAVAKNIKLLQAEIDALQKAEEPTEIFKAYEADRVELAKEHAKKDENGEPLVENNQYVLENKAAFDKALLKVQEKHKEAIEERKKQMDAYLDLLNGEVATELVKVAKSEIDQEITGQQMYLILPIIED